VYNLWDLHIRMDSAHLSAALAGRLQFTKKAAKTKASQTQV